MEAWKLWLLLGVLMAIAELMVVPAQFLLLALGLCAILVGLLTWGFDLSYSAQLAWFAGLAIVLVPVFVKIWRKKAPIRYAGTAGEAGSAPQLGKVLSGDPLTIELHGDRFPAEAADAQSFQPGDRVRVEGFAGITAKVRRAE